MAHVFLTIVSDAALLERARCGDSSAFDELVSRHHAVLFHTARAIVHSAVDAEDVTQNAWLKAYRSLATFKGTAAVRTWLIAIVRNEAIDWQRNARRRLQHMILPVDADVDFRSPLASPEEVLLLNEQRARLRRAIVALPLRLRRPLQLWCQGTHSHHAMSATLRLPIGTVKFRLWEARQQLHSAGPDALRLTFKS